MPPKVTLIGGGVIGCEYASIFAALGKSPADRPQTCAAFAEILGMPLGATATRRVMGRTATRRIPTGATRAYQVMDEEPPVPVWKKPWAIAVALLVLAGGGFGASAGWSRMPSNRWMMSTSVLRWHCRRG